MKFCIKYQILFFIWPIKWHGGEAGSAADSQLQGPQSNPELGLTRLFLPPSNMPLVALANLNDPLV